MKRTKNEFQQYYAREIEKSLGDRGLENVKINLKLPVIKEKLAQWLTNAIQKTFNAKRNDSATFNRCRFVLDC